MANEVLEGVISQVVCRFCRHGSRDTCCGLPVFAREKGGNEGSSGEIFNWIVVTSDNFVTIRIAQMEMGQGAITTIAQLLAEELDADWSKIRTRVHFHLNAPCSSRIREDGN